MDISGLCGSTGLRSQYLSLLILPPAEQCLHRIDRPDPQTSKPRLANFDMHPGGLTYAVQFSLFNKSNCIYNIVATYVPISHVHPHATWWQLNAEDTMVKRVDAGSPISPTRGSS